MGHVCGSQMSPMLRKWRFIIIFGGYMIQKSNNNNKNNNNHKHTRKKIKLKKKKNK